MGNKQNKDILKKFQEGKHSEAIVLCAEALKKNALDQDTRNSLSQAKENIENSSGEDKNKLSSLSKISALQSFFSINISNKFRESIDEKNSDCPISGMKETADGSLIISDDFNHRIQIYDSKYQLKSSFGQKGNKKGEFFYPKGIDIDIDGNIYVADSWNHRIQKFNRDGEFILTFGSYGNETGQFNEPYSVAVDNKNQVLVVDRCNHRVQFFDEQGNYLGAIGHRGRVIEENRAELFESLPEIFSFPSLEFPTDIAIDSKNNIYIIDSHNHRILIFDSMGDFTGKFGKQGKEHGEFFYPQSIAIDHSDNIFISDLNNNRIQLFSPIGEHFFSITKNESGDLIESPTILAIGKEGFLYAGFAFSPKVCAFKYDSFPQNDRQNLKGKFNNLSRESLYLWGNILSKDKNWSLAIGHYEKALSIKSTGSESIIPNLPINYLYAAQNVEQEYRPIDVLTYYDEEISRLHETIIDIYQTKIEINEKQIEPSLEAEKNLLQEKLPSGEIDKNLYDLSREDLALFRKARNVFLELKQITGCQSELFELFLEKLIVQQDNEGIKKLLDHALLNFYRFIDILNSFLNDHDLSNAKCFEEMQKGEKGDFKLRDFRSAYLSMNTPNDFARLSLPVINNYIHSLSQLSIQLNSSKGNSNIELFRSLIAENNISKIGGMLFKLRYDFTATFQLKEKLRVLFSYLNSNEAVLTILNTRSFDKAALLNKDSLNYEKDLVELMLMEELGVSEIKEGLRVGLFCFNEADIDSFQSQAGKESESNYNDFLEKLQNSIKQLLLEKKELDLLILKNETKLNSIHSEDQGPKLKLSYELDLILAQATFGYKLISEHIFLYRIIHFKRALYLLLEFELNRKSNNEKPVEEIKNKISAHYDEMALLFNNLKNDLKTVRTELELWKNNLSHIDEAALEMRRAKEIDAKNRLFQLSKDLELYEMRQNEYASILRIVGGIKDYVFKKSFSKSDSIPVAIADQFQFDLQFGTMGNNKGQFQSPSFLCCNSDGEIFVTDTYNHRVQKFTVWGSHLLTFGGFGDYKGFFNRPQGILCDKNDDLYVCDFLNHRIQKFNSSGVYLMSWGSFGDKKDSFNMPSSICQDNEGFLYIADMGNNRIQKYNSEGQYILSIGKQGKGDGEFSQPSSVCIHNDTLLVGGISSGRIQIFDKNGAFVKSFVYFKETSLDLSGTSCINRDNNGKIYISEFWNNQINILSDDFTELTSPGLPGNLRDHLNGPCGIAFHKNYMFICNHMGHNVYRYCG